MNCQIIATTEAVLHLNELAEHFLLTLRLQLPEYGKVFPQHPDCLYLAHANAPCLHMLSFSIITVDEAEHIALLKLREWLWDAIAKLMELGLNKTVQNNADVEVWEENTIDIMLPNLHLRQELNYVIQLESLEERFHLELHRRMPCKFHLPGPIDVITAGKWVLNRLIDFLERLQVVVDHFKLIGNHAAILHHGQEKQTKQRVNHVDTLWIPVELAVGEV